MDEKKILLTLYSDGTVWMPEAASVGDARVLFAIIAEHSKKLEDQINGLPLQKAAEPPAPPAEPEK